MDYFEKYKNMKEVKLSRKLHNRIFKNRPVSFIWSIFFNNRCFIRIEDKTAHKVETFSIFYKILAVILLPLQILYEGFAEFSFKKYLGNIWCEKKNGKFFSTFYGFK